MKAFACIEPGSRVGWIEKPAPVAGPFDALVKPLIVAPCTSDAHNAFHIGTPAFMAGRVLGHEAVGEIIEVGSQVNGYGPGDLIVIPAAMPRWHSPNLQDGPMQHAEKLNDAFQYAFSLDGVFAEYCLVPEVELNAALLPPDIPLEKAVMACDMMSTGLHGVELAEVEFGDSVVVIGAGPVGLMAVAGAALRGAAQLIVVENKPDRIALATQYGATMAIDFEQGDIAVQVRAQVGKRGVDRVIVAGGGTEAFEAAVKMLRPGGTIANVAMFTGMDALSIPLLAWGSGLSHKNIRGGLCPGGRRRIERMLALIQAGRIDPGYLVTHRLNGLESIEPAFEMMAAAEKPAGLIKPVVYL